MSQADIKSHKIEFPCADYPTKVVGESGANYKTMVIANLGKYAKAHLAVFDSIESSAVSNWNCPRNLFPLAKVREPEKVHQ